MVVLAHLRRRWSLSSREEFGFLSPSLRACEAGFDAFCESETPIFHCAGGKETKAQVRCISHWKTVTGRCGRSDRTRLTRPVSSNHGQRHAREGRRPARSIPHGTGASGHAPRGQCVSVPIERGGASGHVWPDASDRVRSSLDSDRTPGAARLVKWWSASGHGNGSLWRALLLFVL
jgi:hypothetical protein